MINEIKTICKNLIENMRLCDVVFGTLQTDGSVRVDQKLTLPASSVTRPEHLACLASGSTVMLLRCTGGQRYVLIGKVTA